VLHLAFSTTTIALRRGRKGSGEYTPGRKEVGMSENEERRSESQHARGDS
jgi:hypothetical protein